MKNKHPQLTIFFWIAFVLVNVFGAAFAYAADEESFEIKKLQDELGHLQNDFINKQKELSDITLRIHDIQTQIRTLRQEQALKHS